MTATAVAPAAVPPRPSDPPALHLLGLEVLRESPLNPRRHWNEQEILDLAGSLAPPVGMIEPMVVRPHPKGGGATFEIVAGAKRFRAAKKAGLTEVPCLVRALTDAQVIALMVIENNQRGGLHPLDEAQGFVDWMKLAGVDVPAIAAQLGHSIKYVYDRVKLLQLTPKAKKLFLADRITAGHAILLARLDAKTQDEIIDEDEGVLWQGEHAKADEDGQRALDLDDPKKPMTVRELATHINDHVRATEDTVSDQILFPATSAAVGEARQQRLKIVHITREHFVQESARDAGQRTYGPQSWRRADGLPDVDEFGEKAERPSKACDHAVLGLVVAGATRTDAFKVCVAKEKCAVHWPEQVKKAEARKQAAKKAAKKASATPAKGQPAAATQAPKKAPPPFEETPAGQAALNEVLEQRVPAIAAQVAKIAAAEFKGLSDVVVWNLAAWARDGDGMEWAAVGKHPSYAMYLDDLASDGIERVRAALPRKGAAAARHQLALQVYTARDFDATKFGAEVLKAAQSLVLAGEKKAKAAPAKGAKKKAATKKARKGK